MEVVVLAAGLGTRMKSDTPKVLHRLFDRPIIDYVLNTVSKLAPHKVHVVVNPSHSQVIEYLSARNVNIVFQPQPLGTAHALLSALPYISQDILILNGDTPLVTVETLGRLVDRFRVQKLDLAILTFFPNREHSYGRLIRGKDGEVLKIVEKSELTEELSSVEESNSGVYVMNEETAELVREIPINQRKGEYFLTDIVEIAVRRGKRVQAFSLATEEELLGINDRLELALAIKYLRDRVTRDLSLSGVTIYDPSTVWISPDCLIERDTIIYPNVIIEGETKIGKNCIIHQGVRLRDCIVQDSVEIRDYTVAEAAFIGSGSKVGPFAHLRPETVIGERCRIGNFVEIKKSKIGNGSKASHLSYIGDAEVGRNVNIGAGTITCNYDGKRKHRTVIEDDVFIGSDSQLVAPVKICKNAYIGAGSTITKDVPEESLAISRVPQRNIAGWVRKKREKE